MFKYFVAVLGLLLVTACAPRYALEPLCDREAQEWNKFDTQEDNCVRTSNYTVPTTPTPRVGKPRATPVPEHDDPVPTPPDDNPSGPDVDPSPPTEPDVEEPNDEEDPPINDEPDSDGEGSDEDSDEGNHRPHKGNNGHGNGDQDAPGNSCENNNAENVDCEE